MLVLLALPVFIAVAAIQRYLAHYAPSNILFGRVRTSPPRWGTVLALAMLTGGLILTMRAVEIGIEAGGPGWLNIVALVLAWDTIKFAILAGATGLLATPTALFTHLVPSWWPGHLRSRVQGSTSRDGRSCRS